MSKTKAIIDWIDYRLPIIKSMEHATQYRVPKNLSYLWNFGSLAGIALMIQIITGIFLTMHYTPHVDHAFQSVEHIMRDVNYGWLIRYMHAVGASMFFIVVYCHILRGMFYGSYKAPRELLWMFGIVIFLLMMMTAFMGYVLPWGQMSFWGATVITNLFSAIPGIGESVVTWLWGGYSVDNPTLNRFFALHYLVPFLIVGLVILHIAALHQHGSNNPTGIEPKSDKDTIPFHPYYTAKDFVGFVVYFAIFAYFIFFLPNSMGHPDNYIPANPLSTPAHIVPEWYFLPFYAILRAVPNIHALELLIVVGLYVLFYVSYLKPEKIPASKKPLLRLVLILGTLGFITLLSLGLVPSSPVVVSSKLAGVIMMFVSILILFALPWLDSSPIRSGHYRPMFKWFFALLVISFVVLGFMGAEKPEGIFVIISRIATIYYFAYYVVVLPLLSKYETPSILPESISASLENKKD